MHHNRERRLQGDAHARIITNSTSIPYYYISNSQKIGSYVIITYDAGNPLYLDDSDDSLRGVSSHCLVSSQKEAARVQHRGRILLLATGQDMHPESAATAKLGNDVAIYSICCMSATAQGQWSLAPGRNKVPAKSMLICTSKSKAP